jgi:hypothetical protein
MADIEYRIHWLSFTVHAPTDAAFTIYGLLFQDLFGELIDKGHGGRGFKVIYHGLLELKLYLEPVHSEESYFHFEIPGQACDMLSWKHFQALGQILESNFPGQHKFTRFDFAFDHVPFSPEEAESAIKRGQVRSLVKRETLEIHASPFAARDNGEIGTYTVELGSRTSERMIRVYNKRGFTRLELEMRDDRANIVAPQVFRCDDVSEWYPLMMSHLRDYVDFSTDWWTDFTEGTWRAWEVISSPREITQAKLIHWLDQHVSPALSVAVDILPGYAVEAIIQRGRKRRGPRYDLLLSASEKVAGGHDSEAG